MLTSLKTRQRAARLDASSDSVFSYHALNHVLLFGRQKLQLLFQHELDISQEFSKIFSSPAGP